MNIKYFALCILLLFNCLSCTPPFKIVSQQNQLDYQIAPNIVIAGKAAEISINTGENKDLKEVSISPGGPYIGSRLSLDNTATQLLSDNQYIYASTHIGELLIIKPNDNNMEVVAKYQFPDTINSIVLAQNIMYAALANKTISAIDVSEVKNIKQIALYNINNDVSIFAVAQDHIYIVVENTKIAVIEKQTVNHSTSPDLSNQIDMAQTVSDIKIINGLGYITGPRLGLAIVDFSTPTKFQIMDNHTTSGTALEVKIAGDYAYVADGPRGLTLFDISDPNNIRWIGSNNKLGPVLSSEIFSSETQATQVIVNNDKYRLATLNVDNPRLPIVGSLYKPKTSIFHLTLQNNIAYAATNDEILAIDFSVSSNQQISNEGINLGGSRRAYIKDDIAYVADWFSGLHIYDISIPHQPRHLGNFHTPGSSKGVVVRGRYAYIGDDDHGLQIVDISQAQNPKWVSSIQTTGLAYTMSMVDDLIYLADHRGGLHIIDVSNVKKPTLVGDFDTPGKSWAVQVVNNIAYVADDLSGLLIFDVSNPSKPIKIGEFNNGGYAEDVLVKNSKAYVAFFDKGLYILDVSHPQKPTLIGQVDIPGNARSVSVVGKYAYIAGWESGIQIVDIRQATSPKIVGAFDTDGSAWGLDIKDQFAYVWDWWGGVKVIQIQDPINPRLVGKYQSQGRIQNLAINNNYLYTANGSRGVQVFDINNPLNPIWTTGLDSSGTAYDIDIENNIAYIAAGDSGVFAVDISDPFYTRWLGKVATSGIAYKIRVFNKQLYIADHTTGLNIIDASNPEKLTRIAQHPMQINDLWLENNKLYIASNDTGLDVYVIGGSETISLQHRIPFTHALKLVNGNRDLLFAFEVGIGIHIFRLNQNKLDKVTTIPILENVSHIEVSSKQLFVAVDNIGLQAYDISDPDSPVLTTLYPDTEIFTAFKIANDAVFFAGKNTITSTELLPETRFSTSKDGQFNLSVPATLPIGPYHLTLRNNEGKTTFIPNAFHVKLPKPKKSKFTMDDFKKILKQKTQNPNK